MLGHWQLWTLVGLLITGLLLSASTLQAGALSASLPVVDTVEGVRPAHPGHDHYNRSLRGFWGIRGGWQPPSGGEDCLG